MSREGSAFSVALFALGGGCILVGVSSPGAWRVVATGFVLVFLVLRRDLERALRGKSD